MSYSLKAVSSYLGVPPDTVRKWEMRHKLVAPKRLSNGYRIYTEEDLQRLLRFAENRRRGLPVPEAISQAFVAPSPDSRRGTLHETLSAILDFDRPRLKKLCAGQIRRLGLRRAFGEVWQPALVQLGAQAHKKSGIWIAAEHFASAFFRENLLSSLKEPARQGPRLILAAPEGDRHEIGMLAACCALENLGLPCVYLGADLPSSSLAAAVARLRADAVSLTLTIPRARKDVRALIAQLMRAHPRIRIYVCGQESLRHANLIREMGARFIGTDFSRGIDAILSDVKGPAK